MSKGTFQKPIPVDWSYLTDETLRPGGIRVFKNGFSVAIRYSAQHDNTPRTIVVRYFGSAKGNRMWVNSFSYSVQFLNEKSREEIRKDPYRVAKYGLEVVGVAF